MLHAYSLVSLCDMQLIFASSSKFSYYITYGFMTDSNVSNGMLEDSLERLRES